MKFKIMKLLIAFSIFIAVGGVAQFIFNETISTKKLEQDLKSSDNPIKLSLSENFTTKHNLKVITHEVSLEDNLVFTFKFDYSSESKFLELLTYNDSHSVIIR